MQLQMHPWPVAVVQHATRMPGIRWITAADCSIWRPWARGLLTHCLGRPVGKSHAAMDQQLVLGFISSQANKKIQHKLHQVWLTLATPKSCRTGALFFITDHQHANFWKQNKKSSDVQLFLTTGLLFKNFWSSRSSDHGLLDLSANCTGTGIRVSFLIPPCLPDQSLRVITYSFSLHGEYQPSDSRLLNHSTQQSRDPEMHLMPLNHLKWWGRLVPC